MQQPHQQQQKLLTIQNGTTAAQQELPPPHTLLATANHTSSNEKKQVNIVIRFGRIPGVEQGGGGNPGERTPTFLLLFIMASAVVMVVAGWLANG